MLEPSRIHCCGSHTQATDHDRKTGKHYNIVVGRHEIDGVVSVLTSYAHTDARAAAANPFLDGIVAHGCLVVSLAAGLFGDPEPGPVLANYGVDSPGFLTPVYPGDDLTVTLTCKAITPP